VQTHVDGVNVKGGAVLDDELTQVLQCGLLHRRWLGLSPQELAETTKRHRVVVRAHLGGVLAQPAQQFPWAPRLFQKPLQALHGACMGTSSKNLVPQLAGPQTAGLYWWDEQQARQPSRGGLRRQQDSKHGVG
jgi:hypothetical protein